jgi:hypothetical protein
MKKSFLNLLTLKAGGKFEPADAVKKYQRFLKESAMC